MNFKDINNIVSNHSLTENQSYIEKQDVYPSYIRASAGTGKTEIMINKVIRLIKQRKTDISRLFIITFTNKSINEVSSRLKSRLYYKFLLEYNNGNLNEAKYIRNQIEKFKSSQVSTIHSFGKTLINRYGIYADIPPSFEIKNFKIESLNIIRKNVSKYDEVINSLKLDEGYIRNIVQRIIKFYNHRNEEDMLKALYKFNFSDSNSMYWQNVKYMIIDICVKSFIEIYNSKIEKGIMTVNDIIPFTLKMLREEECARQIINDIDYIFVDEFQDSDPGQVKIIEFMMDNGINVCLFGDEKQSIYSFRGADLEFSSKIIKRINDINNNSKKYTLNENFRTDPKLLSYINTIFSSKFDYIGYNLRFDYEKEKSKIIENKFSNPFRIIYKKRIAEIIKDILCEAKKENVIINLEDISILCRTNAEVDYIFYELNKAGIRAKVLGGKSIYNEKCVIDILKIFNAVINKEKAMIDELVYTDFYTSICKLDGESGFYDFMEDLDEIFRTCTINEILEFIYKQTGIYEYYNQINDMKSLDVLKRLIEISSELHEREHVHPIDLLDYLNTMIDNDYKDENGIISENSEGICISTIHKTKGMSLPIVIIPNMDKDIARGKYEKKVIINDDLKKIGIPITKSEQEYDIDYFEISEEYMHKAMEEELRVLYVACTRAKHMLIISSQKGKEEINCKESWINWINNALDNNEI